MTWVIKQNVSHEQLAYTRVFKDPSPRSYIKPLEWVHVLLMLPPSCVLSDLPSRGLNHERWFGIPRLKIFADKFLVLYQTLFFPTKNL